MGVSPVGQYFLVHCGVHLMQKSAVSGQNSPQGGEPHHVSYISPKLELVVRKLTNLGPCGHTHSHHQLQPFHSLYGS
jgi:hypothetical protein